MYSEISSDQPPLFTYILGLVLRIAGLKVNFARLLVLLFSTLQIWASAEFLRLISGKVASILYLPLAIITPHYLNLSVSVMIGLPAIALAMTSITFATIWHKSKKDLWLVLSSIAIACSVLIKLFTVFLVPIILIGFTISIYWGNKQVKLSWKTLRPILIWGTCFTASASLLSLVMIDLRNIQAIISPHVSATTIEEFQSSFYTLSSHLEPSIPLLCFGILGAVVCIIKRNWFVLYPLTWSVVYYILFSFHSPVFYHHQLIITIPVVIMGAAGTGEGFQSLIQTRKLNIHIGLQILLGAIALIGYLLIIKNYIPATNKQLVARTTEAEWKVLNEIERYSGQTNWIVTDMPIYAFHAQLPVPPKLATFSRKLLVTGSLTEEDIINIMREFNPEQVLMARFEIPSLETYLAEHYKLVSSEEFIRLFIRNDLAPVIIE